jgi:hypothetical protein
VTVGTKRCVALLDLRVAPHSFRQTRRACIELQLLQKPLAPAIALTTTARPQAAISRARPGTRGTCAAVAENLDLLARELRPARAVADDSDDHEAKPAEGIEFDDALYRCAVSSFRESTTRLPNRFAATAISGARPPRA